MVVNIANVYPDILNMYGDKGNISALCYRMKKRGINVCVTDYAIGDEIDFESADIVYIGGGTEKDQVIAVESLLKQQEAIKKYVESGGCLVGVCSGYEILGRSFFAEGEKHEGLGILNLEFLYKKDRMIGDIVIESKISDEKIVGFENHSGYAEKNDYDSLGKVIFGFGSGVDGCSEGVIYRNLIGTYIHGPLLPINPKLADYIIALASGKKFGTTELESLDDDYELKARNVILNRKTK